ncbi:MAG: TraR/DksA family transcriptional regulator [Planctomycetaceae bacterium]|jgi:DnaK suppressor protein|nr:TraR/DksA family transcriptional regulator [Planctomycetaceae bacterium]
MKRDELIAKMRPILVKRKEVLRRRLNGDLTHLSSNWDRDEVGDESDGAVGTQDDEIHSLLAQSESEEIQRINAALENMERGEYGLCEECRQPIAAARLEALPYTTTCINCQRTSEANRMRSGLGVDPDSLDDRQESPADAAD